MNAVTTITPALDPIRTFLPGIGEDEYARRAKLQSYRNAATGMIALTHCDTARWLAEVVVQYATPCLYSPAPPEGLDLLNLLCSRLLKTAMTAEQFDDLLRSADDEE